MINNFYKHKLIKNALFVLKKFHLPKNTNVKEMNEAFFYAMKNDAKGRIVFRDRLKRKHLLYAGVYQDEISDCDSCQVNSLPKKIMNR
jgi:hypothetical protein